MFGTDTSWQKRGRGHHFARRHPAVRASASLHIHRTPFGTRKMMQDATSRAGGTVERSITMRTNFVVLGTYVTPAWVHQSFSRKIQKAMDYRDRKGTGVQIVHEEDWARALER